MAGTGLRRQDGGRLGTPRVQCREGPRRHRPRYRHPQVNQRVEQEPQAVRLDQDRRRDPRNPRRLLPTHHRLRTQLALATSLLLDLKSAAAQHHYSVGLITCAYAAKQLATSSAWSFGILSPGIKPPPQESYGHRHQPAHAPRCRSAAPPVPGGHRHRRTEEDPHLKGCTRAASRLAPICSPPMPTAASGRGLSRVQARSSQGLPRTG